MSMIEFFFIFMAAKTQKVNIIVNNESQVKLLLFLLFTAAVVVLASPLLN